jgi:hypothetical protein
MIIYENQTIVAIATFESTNSKTGEMAQIYILAKSHDPVTASKMQLDDANCGDCVHKHSEGGGCYVNLGHGPLAVYKAWKNGKYPKFDLDAFKGVEVRFGAYGDPAFLPFELVQSIARVAKKHTGYTHQWQNDIDPRFARYFMASVDSLAQYRKAKLYNWRTFRVVKDATDVDPHELHCVNETHGIQCIDCGLCNGGTAGRDIFIEAHGARKKRLAIA